MELDEAPSVLQQKMFIVNNSCLLDDKTSRHILTIVSTGVGTHVISEKAANKTIDIRLDEIDNETVLYNIYRAVYARRAALEKPAVAEYGVNELSYSPAADEN